jgi:hypothetical protein
MVIDGAGGYLVPGLMDMHMHLRDTTALRLYLSHGVTTVRCMEGSPEILAWRDAIREGHLVGPAIFAASPILHREPSNRFRHVPNSEVARETVRSIAAQGYDLIKILRLNKDTLFALMDEAKKWNLPVAGHNPNFALDLQYASEVTEPDSNQTLLLEEVVNSGMVSLEHLHEQFFMALDRVPNAAKMKPFVDLVRKSEISIVTIVAGNIAWNRLLALQDDFLTDSLMQKLTTYLGDSGPKRAKETLAGVKSYDAATKRVRTINDVPFILKMIKELNEAGVNIALGTDSGGLLPLAGLGVHDELDQYTKAGLSPYEALRTATYNGAKLLNRLDHVGTVEIGKNADLVLVSENPLKNISTLRQARGVMLRGKWWNRQDLEGNLAKSRQTVKR